MSRNRSSRPDLSSAVIKLGLGIPWDEARPSLPMARIRLAEQLGFDSVWTAESYGSDAFTPLS